MSGASDAGAEERARERQREAHRAAVRRRRLEEVFGTTPDQTSDDLDPEGPSGGRGDTWLREQVPPHHGG